MLLLEQARDVVLKFRLYTQFLFCVFIPTFVGLLTLLQAVCIISCKLHCFLGSETECVELV